MKLETLDLDAPIVPDEALGGVMLRGEIREYQDALLENALWDEDSFELVSPFEAYYRLGQGEVDLAVDVRNGRIFKLVAHPGYRGTLFGSIRVGMIARDAMRLEPRLYYDEAEGAICCRGVAGLQLDFDDPDPPADLAPDLPIAAICVFAKETRTLPGQQGEWWTTG